PVLAETQYPPPPPPPPPAPAAPGQPYGPAPAPAQAPAPYYPRRGAYSYYQPNPAYALRGYIGFSGVGTGVLGQSGGGRGGAHGGGVSPFGGGCFWAGVARGVCYTGRFFKARLGGAGAVAAQWGRAQSLR